MPKVGATKFSTPENLRPFKFHGVDLHWKDGDKDAYADCPLCGRSDKFSVKIETGQYQCWKCKGSGNVYRFIRWLLKEGLQYTTEKSYNELRVQRGLLYAETLKDWKVALSPITRNWVIPGFNAEGNVTQLYQRVRVDTKWKLLPTPTLGHRLYGVNLYDPKKPSVYLCEGPWDGMAWWEALGHCRKTRTGIILTVDPNKSMLKEANVLAVPGCNVFFDSWTRLFSGKDVSILFDNDHPRKHPKTGRPVPSVGYSAAERVSKILLRLKEPPGTIRVLQWGENGYDRELQSGFDIGDYLSERQRPGTSQHRKAADTSSRSPQ